MKITRLCALALALMIAAAFLRRVIPTTRRPETLPTAALPQRLGNFFRYGTVKGACARKDCNLRHWTNLPPPSIPLRSQCPLCEIGIDRYATIAPGGIEANVAARYICVLRGTKRVANLAILRAVNPDPTVQEPLLPLKRRGWFHDPQKQEEIAARFIENGPFRWVVMRRWSVAESKNPAPPQSGDLLVCFYGFVSPQGASPSPWRYLLRHYGKRLTRAQFAPAQTVVAWMAYNEADDGRLSRFAEFADALATSLRE